MARNALLLAIPLVPLCVASIACSKDRSPTADTFTPGMVEYLQRRGDLCLGKTEWPIDVTDDEVLQQSRSGLQMPVLEQFGLARSAPVSVELKTENGEAIHEPGRRYTLTAEGERYEVVRETNARDHDGERIKERDFCPVKIDLDRIVGFELEQAVHPLATVTYTYRITAPDWTRQPEVERVFPAMARVIRGDRKAFLKETFVSTDRGFVAVDLYDEPKLLASGPTH